MAFLLPVPIFYASYWLSYPLSWTTGELGLHGKKGIEGAAGTTDNKLDTGKAKERVYY
jgi:hypothetical protein